MKRQWRDFFYYSKADRRVLLLLAGMVTGVALASLFLMLFESQEKTPTLEGNKTYENFFNGLQQTDSVKTVSSPTIFHYDQGSPPPAETFYFDPNTADSTELLRLGLRPWQVRNIYKYRARGGRYHRPEDFSRLYGLTKGDYDRLCPYIRIADEYKLIADLPQFKQPQDSLPTAVSHQQEKFTQGVLVDLNLADTTTLKKIPGIGSYYARRIIEYRTRLGGFVSVRQLNEIKELPQEVHRWFTIDSIVPPSLHINRMSLEQLRRHPYLNFYQSKVIVEHRRKYGPIKKMQALSLYEEFPDSVLQRLQSYICLDE